MNKRLKVLTACIFGGALLCVQSSAQNVSLSTPAAWSTLRTDSVFAKAQVDTAGMKKKQINYTLSSVSNGTSKVIIKQQVKVSDVSVDAFLNKLNTAVLGGTSFLKIEWEADSQKGEILPFGIVDLNKLPKIAPVQAKFVDEKATLKSIADGVKDEQLTKVGTRAYTLFWNNKALYYVIKKSTDTLSLNFGLDGKNGKNAFVAYSDRFIVCKKDSVWGIHYNRTIENALIKYPALNWDTDIVKEVVGDKIIVQMPWYDTGIVPFSGRVIGFAVFGKNKEKAIFSSPEKAAEYIPGTWGNLILSK